MLSDLKRRFKDLKKGLKKKYKKSYSQCGEDIIADFILRVLDIRKPIYLDIGAHDPVRFNNTFLFYGKGCTGVNIEPNPFLFKRLKSRRRRDINLNVGLASEEGAKDFYILTSWANTLNTFSKETAERYERCYNQKIKKTIRIEVLNVNDVIRRYFETRPNFVSLDVEGGEMEVLKSFDFEHFRPEVFCIETVPYTEDASGAKDTGIIDFMRSAGYAVYADTYINTIFVDERAWKGTGI